MGRVMRGVGAGVIWVGFMPMDVQIKSPVGHDSIRGETSQGGRNQTPASAVQLDLKGLAGVCRCQGIIRLLSFTICQLSD